MQVSTTSSKTRRTAAHAAAFILVAFLTAPPTCANVPPIVTALGAPAIAAPSRLSEPEVELPDGVAPESPPTDVPGEEGDLRLVGRVDINGFATGALQVFHSGAYGAVCSNNFDSVAADVACRQLGFIGGAAVPLALAPDMNPQEQRPQIESILAPMVLENLACTGNETRLVDCPGFQQDDYGIDPDYAYSTSNGCDPLQATYAFVACGNTTGPERGDLRLVGGQTSPDGDAQFGRLEVFSDGGWGFVCDRTGRDFGVNKDIAIFTDDSVDVACKQLGFVEGTKTPLSRGSTTTEQSRIPVLLAGAGCTGSEDALTDCPGVGFGNSTSINACGLTTSNLVISCFNGPTPGKDGELRLVNGSSGPGYEYGRLEIFIRGFWSTICDRGGFTPDSALVACKALGFDGGSSLEFRQEYSSVHWQAENQVLVSTLPVGLASVDCNGTETSLLDCASSESDPRECDGVNSNRRDATVLACANTADSCDKKSPEEEGSVRLRGGFGSLCDPAYTGFVEVFHFDEWGAICNGDEDTDTLAADVICRQLGFPHGTVVDPLTNPADADDGGGYAYTPSSFSGYEEEAEEAQERFWLNQVRCQGPEEKLVDCDLGPGFRTDNGGCTQDDNPIRLTVACRTFAVAEALEEIATPGAKDGDVRLVDQQSVSNWEIGRLEIFFEGSWSQVCAAQFKSADAYVACRQLGFGAGSVGPNLANGVTAAATDQIVFPVVALTIPDCNGTEASLLECGPADKKDTLGRSDGRDCFGDDGLGLTLACVAKAENGEEGALRLTDGGDGGSTASGVGILEVFHAGAWGTVCEGGSDAYDYAYGSTMAFTESSAAIVCRELGFKDGIFTDVTSVPANVTLLPAWLGALPCVGNEATLGECDGLDFGNTETCGLTQRLVCSATAGTGSNSTRGAARLTGGRADPGGAWAYGRLEVSDGQFFSSVVDPEFSQSLGRRGAQVACRSLGFTAGAQMVSGTQSALPGPSGEVYTIATIACQGDEESLADCEITMDDTVDYGQVLEDQAVALLCSNPSGCSANASAPAQGDVRLVDLDDTPSGSAPCDEVHFGGVEVFNDGQWGRICDGRFNSEPQDFTIDAKVICRQLGFPFGSLMDVEEASNSTGVVGADYEDYSAPGDIVWATDVVCTGKEERLDECFFPQGFGDAPSPYYDYTPPVQGLRRSACQRQDGRVLGVVCRQFEIKESDVIRRL